MDSTLLKCRAQTAPLDKPFSGDYQGSERAGNHEEFR
jgi:hypothetical protein